LNGAEEFIRKAVRRLVVQAVVGVCSGDSMKRILWAIAISLGVAIGIPYYFWQQATATPDWYRDHASISLRDPVVVEAARQQVAAKMAEAQPQPDGTQEVSLTSQDVNAIAVTTLNELARKTQLTDAIASVNSSIQDGRIQSGAVINLANVPPESLNPTEREIVTLIRSKLPGLVDREIYVGVEGQPTIQNGQLQFDDTLRIKIGNLSLSAADVANQLGISEATLWQTLNRELSTLQIQDVQIVNDQLRLRGTL